MHYPLFENQNKAIVEAENEFVPPNYFNIVKLQKGEAFSQSVAMKPRRACDGQHRYRC